MANPAAEARARLLAKFPEAVVVERGRYHIKHRLPDGPDGRQRFALDSWLPPIAGAAPDTVNDQVAANTDDMHEEEVDGDVVDGATSIYGQDYATSVIRKWPGFRWDSPTGSWPAQGSTIDVAYMEAYFDSTLQDNLYCHIYAEDAAGPSTFVAGAANFNITGRTPTTAKVDWQADDVGTGFVQSPSLVSVIQELVTDYTITAIVLIWKPGTVVGGHATKAYYTHAVNDDGAKGAKLHIEYSVGGVTHEGAASLSGSGTATTAGVVTIVAAASLSASGSLAAVGTVGELHEGAAVVAATGTLSAIGVVILKAALTLAGAGALAVAAVATVVGSASPAGAGTLTAAAVVTRAGAASLSGEGTLSAAGQIGEIHEGAAVLAATGTLGAAGVCTLVGAASVAGEGALSTTLVGTFVGAAALAGGGTATVSASPILTGATSLAGTGTLQVAAINTVPGAASVQGQGTLTVAATLFRPGAASLSASGALTVAAQNMAYAAASLSGEGALTISVINYALAVTSLSGEGVLAAAAQNTIEIQVDTGSDDASQLEPAGSVADIDNTYDYLTSSPIEILRRWGGYRWDEGPFPTKGDTITVAYLKTLQPHSTLDDPSFDIYAEDGAAPSTFVVEANNITARTRTTALVSWDEDNIGVGWNQSPSLVSVIQELVNDYDITSLVLILKPKQAKTRVLAIVTQDYSVGTWAAKLHLEWSTVRTEASLGGEGTLSVSACVERVAKASLAGEGTLAADATNVRLGAASLSGEGTLVVYNLVLGAVSLAGDGTLTVVGWIIAAAVVPVGHAVAGVVAVAVATGEGGVAAAAEVDVVPAASARADVLLGGSARTQAPKQGSARVPPL